MTKLIRVIAALPLFLCRVSGQESPPSGNLSELAPGVIESLRRVGSTEGFKPYEGGPILKPGPAGSFDAGALGSMCVLRVGNVFHLYYEAWGVRTTNQWIAGEYESLQIGHATSADGLHWTKDPLNPVLPHGEKPDFDRTGVWDPYVIHEDGLFKMWYGGGGGSQPNLGWAYATSADGSHFKKKGLIGVGNQTSTEDCHVVRDPKSQLYHMYYWYGRDEPHAFKLVTSATPTGFDFNNAIKLTIAGDDSPMSKFGHVLRDDDGWHLFYSNFERAHCPNSIVRYATSTDGIHWQEGIKGLVKGHDADVLRVADDLYLMVYSPQGGFDANGTDIRLAVYNGRLPELANKPPLALLSSGSFADGPQSLPKFKLPLSPMADMSYIGKAVTDPNYFIWCTSPLQEADGKVHLFCSRWPNTQFKMKPWTTHSEIVYYVADQPEGPFHFADLAMACASDAKWNNSIHNPAIAKVGDTYVLLYVTFDQITADKGLKKRWVCMATSKSPGGPWLKMGETGEFAGRIIAPPTDAKHWTFSAGRGFDNPTFLAYGGRFYIYFKTMSTTGHSTRYGYAVADKLGGPYVLGDEPCTDNTDYIEDATAFVWDNKINLVVTDNFGSHTGVLGAGNLWQSDTPTQFKLADAKVGFMLPDHYWPTPVDHKVLSHPKGSFKFERPGVLLQNGRPAYFYSTPGDSPEGDETTSSYVFKINLPSR